MKDTNTRSKLIDKNEAIDIILKNCGDFKPTDIPIYRGLYQDSKYLYVNPIEYVRPSQNTNNIYTTIIDNSPYWKEYPKRSKSIICTTNYNISESYGDVYRVIPFNNSKWGICQYSDIWTSFHYIKNVLKFFNMEDFNMIIGHMITKERIPTNQNELLEILKNINYKNIIINNYNNKEFSSLEKTIEDLLKNYDNLYDLLIDIIKPDINNFKVKTYDEIKNITYYLDREIWTDSNCILVYNDLFNDLINSIPMLNEKYTIKTFKKFIQEK